MVRLWVPGPLPGLNEIIDAKARKRGRWDAYQTMKRKWGSLVAMLARAAGLPKIEPSHFHYRFVELNRRRDPLNFLAGGIKLIEDGLQEAGVLENDGWTHVLSISTEWSVGKQAGVDVTIRREGE